MKTFKVFVPVVVKPKQSGVISRVRGKASMRKDPDVAANADEMSMHILRAMDGYDKEYTGPIAAFLLLCPEAYKESYSPIVGVSPSLENRPLS